MIREIWKDIEDYEGCYQASNFEGRIKSLARIVKGFNGSTYKIKERILKSCIGKDGYLSVALCKDSKPKTLKIHHLVLETFGFKKPSKNHEGNHKDGIKINNNLSNLEWVTKKENTHHAYQMGLIENKKMPSNKEIKEIQGLHALGKVSRKFLSKKYNIGKTTVWKIIHNKIAPRNF